MIWMKHLIPKPQISLLFHRDLRYKWKCAFLLEVLFNGLLNLDNGLKPGATVIDKVPRGHLDTYIEDKEHDAFILQKDHFQAQILVVVTTVVVETVLGMAPHQFINVITFTFKI
ncbi:hypothetical protein WA026_017638 [Henosepilachna vigintioctopunctata]|uniref:Uncharacterized protein n=1 Tax=Henosepilachna vigintioctopunctata TaxID=420089 RepID=A0AAW1V0Q0_9CUCU